MIKLEIQKGKKGMKDSFVVRADEPMRFSFDLTDSGELIVYGYTGTEDDTEQDPVIWHGSESMIKQDMTYIAEE